MKNYSLARIRILGLLCAVALLLAIAPAGVASADTTSRPISDFVSQQGQHCCEVGSVPNYIGWGNVVPPAKAITFDMAASVDYAGLANDWIVENGGTSLGTTITGTITERVLPGGRADVDVNLHTSNALTWVVQGTDFKSGPLLFGHRAQDVLDGSQPALGDSNFEIRFINTAPGAPLPDLMDLFFSPGQGQQLESYSFSARASGTLASGTYGHVTVAQTGNAVRSNIQASRIVLTPSNP